MRLRRFMDFQEVGEFLVQTEGQCCSHGRLEQAGNKSFVQSKEEALILQHTVTHTREGPKSRDEKGTEALTVCEIRLLTHSADKHTKGSGSGRSTRSLPYPSNAHTRVKNAPVVGKLHVVPPNNGNPLGLWFGYESQRRSRTMQTDTELAGE